MNLTQLFKNHKEKFRQKLTETIAQKNSLTYEAAASEHASFINQYIDEKLSSSQEIINKINKANVPVFLNIRRNRECDEKEVCMICEGNEPNIQKIINKYKNKIQYFEIAENKPEVALYHIIYHEENKDKKLPLTAVINKGVIIKFWAGKTVDVPVYEEYINKLI